MNKAILYILDDEREFRNGLIAELLKLRADLEIKAWGDRKGDDSLFTREVIKAYEQNTEEKADLFVVSDIRMRISSPPWISRRDEHLINVENQDWLMDFSSEYAHGYNILRAIRYRCPEVKMATMSASTEADLKIARGGKPSPTENEFYRHIRRDCSDRDMAKQLQAFFRF